MSIMVAIRAVRVRTETSWPDPKHGFFWTGKQISVDMECGGGLACVRMWKTGLPCVYCAAGGGWMVEVAHIHCSSGRQPALGLGALTLAPLTRGGGWAPTPTNLTSSSRYGLTDPALWSHSQTWIGLPHFFLLQQLPAAARSLLAVSRVYCDPVGWGPTVPRSVPTNSSDLVIWHFHQTFSTKTCSPTKFPQQFSTKANFPPVYS